MPAPAKTPTARAFRAAFLALEPQLTPTRRRILAVHYRALDRQLTMTQIAEALGWGSYSSANSHYGRLVKLVGAEAGFRHPSCHLATLCTFVRPAEKGDHRLIIMRKEVAAALKTLGWFDAGKNSTGITPSLVAMPALSLPKSPSSHFSNALLSAHHAIRYEGVAKEA